MKVCISSGHGKYIRGAAGPKPWGLDEVDEARKVVETVATNLRNLGVEVLTYHDDVSDDQDENLQRIVDWHNSQGPHDLDCSTHFNAYEVTDKPRGHEVFYQSKAGFDIADVIVGEVCIASGLIDRGAKEGNLYFLNHTAEVAVLIEVCFVDSKADCDIYRQKYDAICQAIANAIGEEEDNGLAPKPPEPQGDVLFYGKGTCSWFGGPDDDGVSEQEGLAFIYDWESAPSLFLPNVVDGDLGLARNLNPEVHYLACRWDYSVTSKESLRDSGQLARVTSVRTGRWALARPSDWGPHEEKTGRVADLSPSLMRDLELETDDVVEVIYPAP